MLEDTVTIPERTIISSIPGRIRVKIRQLYKNPELAQGLRALIDIPGVNQVETNIFSQSLLILYESREIVEEKLLHQLDDYMQSFASSKNEQDAVINLAASTNEAMIVESPTEAHLLSLKNQWHQMSVQQILQLLNTDQKGGLRTEQAKAILQKLGLNEFAEKKKDPLLTRFLAQFDGFLIKLLLGASGISIFLGQVGDALTILTIIIVEAALGVWQSYKAEKSLEALKEYTAARSRVLRDGTVQQVPARLLVPGDIICLEAGDLVPADARLLESANLEVNEASLTGESLPIEKSHKVKHTSDVPLADRKNMLFMGTSIARGTGKAVVVQTGMRTELGQIARMINESAHEPTPLQQDLNRLARIISLGCIGICGGIMLSGILGGQPAFEMLRTGVSLAIGAIPEGLTSVLTISLAFGVQRMARKGAIVKELPATEILSCADVICTDKTGTLTTGQMTVTELYTPVGHYHVTGGGYSTQGKFFLHHLAVEPRENPDLARLITTGALCNNTTYSTKKDEYAILGDPTEGALWVLAAKANLQLSDFSCYTREKEVAFDSDTKKMVVICKDQAGHYSVHMKGDPNIILAQCTKIFDGSKVVDLTPEHIASINQSIDEMAGRALRVIGFAMKETGDNPPEESEIEKDMVFIGLTGMMDPPRPEVADAVQRCHKAGIRLVMITGDHKRTAEAIGRQIHLFDRGGKVITGEELDQLSDDDLRAKIDDIAIFARTSPHQKLRIVKALKAKGHIVAMTGDGVNDAPAIKEANIGIAMGKNGTDVTLQSSSIILTDDNFTTIVNAIEEGRGISGNIKKFMRFVLAGNIGEVLAIFVTAMLRLPVPLIPGQILMINLITEGIPALSLGVDTPDVDNMSQPPRDASKSIFDHSIMVKTLSRGIMMGISTLGLYASAYLVSGNLIKARTLAYANLVANQMFHVFDCRKAPLSENKYIVPSVVIASLLLLSTIYLTPLQGLFGTCGLGAWDWMYILFMSSFIGRLDYIKEKASQLIGMPMPATV